MSGRPFQLTTLGTGAALPARGRFPTAQLLNVHDGLYLIDCGEGTQERLRVAGVNFMRIGHVFISHMHGDHYLGLMGLISSMHLMGRTTELHVHGPAVLHEVIQVQLRASETWLRYPLHFHPLVPRSGEVAWTDGRVEVSTLALRHRVPCTGFVFRERPGRRTLRPDMLPLIPPHQRNAVKDGADVVLPDGRRIANAGLTLPPPVPRRYAYCSDTAFEPALIPYLEGVDLLYHEATFTQALLARARETMHSTAAQAATMAREAGVGELLLGHFSSRYKDAQVLLDEARAIFPRTALSYEGGTFLVAER
jgi:ribonuclease Z